MPSIQLPSISSVREMKLSSSEIKIPKRDLYREAIEKNSMKQLAVAKIEKKKNAAVIKKEIKIQNVKEYRSQEVKELEAKVAKTDERYLSLEMHIQHNGFEISAPQSISIADAYNDYLKEMSQKLALLENKKATNEKAVVAYDPTNKKLIDNFEKQQLEDVVKVVESSTDFNTDDIVFIDYTKNKDEEQVYKEEKANVEKSELKIANNEKVATTIQEASVMAIESSLESLEDVSKLDISHRVTDVIKREMNGEGIGQVKKAKSYTDLLKKFNKESPITQALAAPVRDFDEDSKMTIHALHTDMEKGMEESVHGFSMYAATDNNKVYDDLNEGKIEYNYSLNGYSGLLRATLVKNFYMRTTIEVPLTGEYSNVEVPLIDIKSIETYIDKNELSGYGGYYLVDLGEYFEDVEISSDQNTQNSYEQRVYLNEDFKIVKSAKNYRYILFLGVIPGNVRVQYLGANRTEASKITFVAPDEVTFDVATAQPSHEIIFDLTLKNTLGVQNVPLDLDTQKMKTFVGNMNPSKVASGKYVLNIPWATKGSRTYVEVNHLDSPIFVGIDGNNKLELPSLEFVQEILRSFSIDELHSNECLVHINFDNKEVVNVKVRGESSQGPMTFEQSFLDKDGVFTKYVSPMSSKLFILGNEEGIFPVEIEYANGKKDYMRTYCSPGTYLLEQL